MADDNENTETTTTTTKVSDRTPEEIAATVRKLSAEARKIEAEAKKAEEEAEQQSYERIASKIACDMIIEKDKKNKVADEYHRIYRFTGTVDSNSTKRCAEQLVQWSRLDPGCPMEIVFFSPGGSVMDGMMLYDCIQELRRMGHHITTTAEGYAASMGGILLQAGDHRRMGKEAYILIHEVAFGAVGKIGEVEDEVAFARKITKRILNIFASRSKLSAVTIDKKWRRKDWWLDSDEALKYGFVDEVL